MFYQVSERHGYHIATTLDEAKNNEKHGWKTVTETEFYDRPKKTAQDEPSDLERRYEDKFGKKPHHRMKPESIEAALNDNRE